MTTFLEDELSLHRVTRKDSNREAFCIDHTTLGRAEHLLTRDTDLLNSSVVELVELAFKRYNNVLLAVLSINALKLHFSGASHSRCTLDEGVCGAKEALKDLVVTALVNVTGKSVLTFGHSMLQTVLTILVIDAFHGGIREYFVRLAQLCEFLVCLGFLLARIAHWMVCQSQVAVGFGNLFTVCSGVDSERGVVPRLIAVHFLYYWLLSKILIINLN